MATKTNNSGGLGFLGALAIVFITLKLLGTITWSWWLVLTPLWVPMAVVLFLLLIVALVAMSAACLK